MIILTEKEYFYANSKGDAEDKLCGTVIRYQYDKMDHLTRKLHKKGG